MATRTSVPTSAETTRNAVLTYYQLKLTPRQSEGPFTIQRGRPQRSSDAIGPLIVDEASKETILHSQHCQGTSLKPDSSLVVVLPATSSYRPYRQPYRTSCPLLVDEASKDHHPPLPTSGLRLMLLTGVSRAADGLVTTKGGYCGFIPQSSWIR